MKKFLLIAMIAAFRPVSCSAVMPPSTSLEPTDSERLAQESKDPRYQVIPVQTVLKVDRLTGKIWILENNRDGDQKQSKWVEYKKDQSGWPNRPR